MSLFEEIGIEVGLLNEDVDVASISDAINTMRPAYIKYNSGGKNKATGRRLIYPVAYGMSSAGNPVVRAFEEQGDSETGVPAWKFFRVDRIMWWRTVKDKSHSFKDKELVGLNKSGNDKGMTQIFTLSPLCGRLNDKNEPEIDAEPITKGEVENPSVEKNDAKSEKWWNPKKIGRDIYNFFHNWRTKYQKEPEVSLDNKGNITYNNGEVSRVEKMKAPETEPTTKSDIANQEPEPNAQQGNGSENNLDKMRADNEPVTKGEVEDNKSEDMAEEPEITKTFRDMNQRWDNLNKEES